MSALVIPMVRSGRFATPEEVQIENLRRSNKAFERRQRADRQARAHETLTNPGSLFEVLQHLDVEDGVEFADTLLAAIRDQDITDLSVLLTTIAHADAKEAIP